MLCAMRALVVAAVAVIAVPTATTVVRAADLTVAPVKRHVVHHRHVRARLVRDYDGTAILIRRARPTLARPPLIRPDAAYDVAVYDVARRLDETVPVPGAMPSRYLNGQPVRPTDRPLRYR